MDDKLLEQTFPRRLLVAVNLSQILCHGLVMTSIPVKPDPDTRGFERMSFVMSMIHLDEILIINFYFVNQSC